jgi:uncharacterized protein
VYEYSIGDFSDIATGAAVLASGGGGSYHDALGILAQLAERGWSGTVPVHDYDGKTNACVLALMGSPDAAESMSLDGIEQSIGNTVTAFRDMTQQSLGCVVPVEIGPINSLIPLIAASLSNNAIGWVVDGDGAGRAVPELPQTTYGGSGVLTASPCVLANDATTPAAVQSALLNASSAAQVETLAGGILAAFGSYAGIALWASTAQNGFALEGNYLPGTLEQTRLLGNYLTSSGAPPSTAEIASRIADISQRTASPLVTNAYITAVTQSTTGASLDTGIIRLDDTPEPARSTHTHYLYNLNENLILYSSHSDAPIALAPDSICYYSESTGRGFSNADDDLAPYFDFDKGATTGRPVSLIKVAAATQLRQAPGVVASFAQVLREIGYAGAMPYPE